MEEARQCVYGRNAVAALLQSGQAVDTVLLADALDEKTARAFTGLARGAGAVVKRAKPEKLDTLSGGARHQGVLAFAAQVAYCDVADILAAAAVRGEPPFLLLCDGVADPHNLGALLRSALLCGAHGAVIPKRGAAGVTPVVMKSSAGAAARLPIARVANLGESIRRLKEKNVFVYCADMDGAPLGKQSLAGPVALVVGSEGRGVGPLIRKLCDGAVALPMAQSPGVDSFNVSVAGGILLYDIYRQRNPAAFT